MLVLTLGTDRLIPLFDRSEWDGSDAASLESRLFFIKHYVGQQTDLEQDYKPYWQSMKWKRGGTLCVNRGDFVTTRVSRF